MNKTDTNEELFNKHLLAEKISATRNLCLLGGILFLVFSIADVYSLSSSLFEAIMIRAGVVCVLLGAIAVSFSANFDKYYDLVLCTVLLVTAGAIEALIYLASPEDHASNVYFAGIVLINMIIFSWTYLRHRTSAAILTLIASSYALIVINKGMSIPDTLVNVLFLLSAAVLGVASMFLRDNYRKENFLLQLQLKEALADKTAEAKDHQHLANHDALTGLPNRRHMTELLELSMQEAIDKDKLLVIMFLDLNGFKAINDTYGHATGDEVLKVVAKRLEVSVNGGDHVSRLGGDEYLIGLLLDKDNYAETENLTERVTNEVSRSMNIGGVKVNVGTSIGIAAYPYHGDDVSVLMDLADEKMYADKKGRDSESKNDDAEALDNKIAFFPSERA